MYIFEIDEPDMVVCIKINFFSDCSDCHVMNVSKLLLVGYPIMHLKIR